jgi:hypothetical protein
LILFDLLDLDCIAVKANPIVLDIQVANLFEDPLIPFWTVLAFGQKIGVSGGTISLFRPELKEQRSFEHKGVLIWRPTDPVEDSFQPIFGEEEVEVFLLLAGAVEEPLFDGRRDVRRYGLAHVSDSI